MRYSALCVALSWAVGSTALGQGSLTPPGAPAATMKTLQQVEPRVDVATLPGNFATEHIITSPGSYYLSGNINPNNVSGVRIAASGVALDLNGFEIAPAVGTPTSGVTIESSLRRVTVRNGTIRGFGYGVVHNSDVQQVHVENITVTGASIGGIVGDKAWTLRKCNVADGAGSQGGIFLRSEAIVEGCSVLRWTGSDSFDVGSNSVVRSCMVRGGTDGIYAQEGSAVSDCTVSGVSGDWGIRVGEGSVVSDCAVTACAVLRGIETADSSVVRGCTVSRNSAYVGGIHTLDGAVIVDCSVLNNVGGTVSSYGIFTQDGSTVTRCVSRNNSNTNSPAVATHGVGIRIGGGSVVQDCVSIGNRGNGIQAAQDCRILNNTCDSNGSSGDGAGIFVTSSDTRVEGNNVTDNDRGIHLDNAGDSIVLRNTASGNATNYEIDTGNRVGTIVNAPSSVAISGSTGGSGVGSTDPWANFSF